MSDLKVIEFINVMNKMAALANIDMQEVIKVFIEGDSITLEGLNVNVRILGNLKAGGITTIRQLTQLTDVELLKIPDIGKKAWLEIKTALAQYGLKLA